MNKTKNHNDFPATGIPMEWEDLTQIKGPYGRHIEQLWDEVHKLKHKFSELEKRLNKESDKIKI